MFKGIVRTITRKESMSMLEDAYTCTEIPPILTVPQLAEFLNVGRNSVYDLVNSAQIKVIRIGKNIRIPRHAVLEYLGTYAA